MSKPRIIVWLLLIVCFCIAGAWLRFLFTPLVSDSKGYHYVLKPMMTATDFLNDLTKRNVIKDPLFFKLLIRMHGNDREWKAGEYVFPAGSTPSDIIDQIIKGRGLIYHSIIFIEGWNFSQIRAAILKEPSIHHHILKMTSQEIMQHIGSTIKNPEGQFYPDTYYFVEGSSDIAILKQAYHAMQSKLFDEWLKRDAGLPFSEPYQALIAASLIEKETHLQSERTMVAGVLINRINKKMLLQFDPTVIYDMGPRYKGKIRRADLRKNTPSNTYIHKGLPPTPIAMPSAGSIHAVLHPEQHNYLYFVAKNDGTGGHYFSSTLEEHNKAIRNSNKRIIFRKFFNEFLMKNYLKGQLA